VERLIFDVYGQYVVHVERVDGAWRVLRVGADGKRALLGVEVPPDLPAADLAEHLDDLLHETAGPGEVIRRVGG
jgi:hypothetical protein